MAIPFGLSALPSAPASAPATCSLLSNQQQMIFNKTLNVFETVTEL